MKTISLLQNKYSPYIILFFLSAFLVSCGSYQNTSYYDKDGIYGSKEPQDNVATTSESPDESNQYKNYFESLQDPSAKKDSTFTDVEQYSSESYNNQGSQSNSVWGSDSGATVVNIYDNSGGWNNMGWNNYWNWNVGWGWNSWYGPNWGWGWNNWNGQNWGWGWNSWYGNPWCGGFYQPNFQQYHQGTRSFAGVNDGYSYGGNRNFEGRRNNNSEVRSTTSRNNGVRNTSAIRNPRSNNNNGVNRNIIRNSANTNSNNNAGTRYNTNTTSRNQTNTTRSYNSTSTRNNSSNSGGYNSGGRSSGGSYGGGSYGGGRSSGGRR